LTDIENAILSNQKAVDLTPDDHPSKPGRLSDLGISLQTRFNRLGNLKDIENAISSKQKAVDLTPDGHPDKAGYLSNLGNSLQTRFDRLGNLTDIEDAILSKQKAADLTPDGHPDKPDCLSNLGNSLEARFDRFGNLTDIENAILNNQKAVDLTPDGHPSKPARLSNLGGSLHTRFSRLGSLKDIENAILSNRKAVNLTPDDHPSKPGRLSNLGILLRTRFDRLGNLTDIDDAILSQRKAADLTPDDHPSKPGYLSNIGNSLQTRFDRLGNPIDVENAILSQQKAVDLTPDGHPDKPSYLSNLGNSLSIRLERLQNLGDLEAVLLAYSQAAMSPTAAPIIRFHAACAWAKHSDMYSRFSLSAYRSAIDLLPRVAWLGLPVTDQHALLADIGDITRNAVSAAIRSGELETAVQWAEQGRSIVWQNMLGLRTPVDNLRAEHPQLADRIQDIARHMETPTTRDVAGANLWSSQLGIAWENTVEEIRRLPGFEGFLKAKTFSQLAPAAHEGPVVILNVDESRSDALVLIADDSEEKHVSVVNIPLTRFSYQIGQNLCKELTSLLKTAGVRDRGEVRKGGLYFPEGGADTAFQNILRTLWQDIVQPVVVALKYQVCHRNDG